MSSEAVLKVAAAMLAAIALNPGALAQGNAAQGYPSKPIRLIIPFPQGGKPGSRRGGCFGGGARTRYWRSQPFAGSAPGPRYADLNSTQMLRCEGDRLRPPGLMHRALRWAVFAMAAAASTCALPVAATDYPVKPIRLIIPFAPGGGTDITARWIALKLGEAWGQTVIPDNRAGANGTIGMDITMKAAPDGYTLTMISSSHAVNVGIYKNLNYDLIKDFAPITQATTQPYSLLVHPSVPAKSVKELIALAKGKPGTLNYGSSGTGGLPHLSGALFASLAEVSITHVPYKGGAPSMSDAIAGQIQMLFSTILQSRAHTKSGRLRALAVTTVNRSAAAPEAFGAHIKSEVTKWVKVVRDAGIRGE